MRVCVGVCVCVSVCLSVCLCLCLCLCVRACTTARVDVVSWLCSLHLAWILPMILPTKCPGTMIVLSTWVATARTRDSASSAFGDHPRCWASPKPMQNTVSCSPEHPNVPKSEAELATLLWPAPGARPCHGDCNRLDPAGWSLRLRTPLRPNRTTDAAMPEYGMQSIVTKEPVLHPPGNRLRT